MTIDYTNNDMYDDFSDQHFDYDYPYSFKERNKDYLKENTEIMAWWYYGDTIDLTFKVIKEDNVEQLNSSYFDDKLFILSFYNYRGEVILSSTYGPENVDSDTYTITFSLDPETSKNIFVPGVYRCGLVMTTLDNSEITTIVDPTLYTVSVR